MGYVVLNFYIVMPLTSFVMGTILGVKDGYLRCVKKFYGLYDGKFTGYEYIGFSPDGKHLIYGSTEHLIPLGSIIHNMINGFTSNIYIMDLDTEKSAKFMNSSDIQWIMD